MNPLQSAPTPTAKVERHAPARSLFHRRSFWLGIVIIVAGLCLAPGTGSAASLRVWPKLKPTTTGEVSVTCPIYLLGATPGSHYVAVLASGDRFHVQVDELGCGYITTLRTTVANGTNLTGTVRFFSPEGIGQGELNYDFPVHIPLETPTKEKPSLHFPLWIPQAPKLESMWSSHFDILQTHIQA